MTCKPTQHRRQFATSSGVGRNASRNVDGGGVAAPEVGWRRGRALQLPPFCTSVSPPRRNTQTRPRAHKHAARAVRPINRLVGDNVDGGSAGRLGPARCRLWCLCVCDASAPCVCVCVCVCERTGDVRRCAVSLRLCYGLWLPPASHPD